MREEVDDGVWRHREIRLEPDSDLPGCAPIAFAAVLDETVRVVADLVEVLGKEQGIGATLPRWG